MEVIKILNPIVMFMDVCGGSASKWMDRAYKCM